MGGAAILIIKTKKHTTEIVLENIKIPFDSNKLREKFYACDLNLENFKKVKHKESKRRLR